MTDDRPRADTLDITRPVRSVRAEALALAIAFYRPQGPTSPGLIVETAKGFLTFLEGPS